jgi:hypothetical protein
MNRRNYIVQLLKKYKLNNGYSDYTVDALLNFWGMTNRYHIDQKKGSTSIKAQNDKLSAIQKLASQLYVKLKLKADSAAGDGDRPERDLDEMLANDDDSAKSILFYILGAYTEDPARHLGLEKLTSAIFNLSECIRKYQEEEKNNKGGRPSNELENQLASFLYSIWPNDTKNPGKGLTYDNLVKDVFELMSIKTDPDHAIKKAKASRIGS